jgi:hypothetical protein
VRIRVLQSPKRRRGQTVGLAWLAPLTAGTWLAAPGCNNPHLAGIAQDCSLNSDCNLPLVCVFQRCHNACRTPSDCPARQRCIPSGAGMDNVCQLEDESACISGTCASDLVCGNDQECRAPCPSSGSCVTGQTCSSVAGEPACLDPRSPADIALLNGSVADAGVSADSGRPDATAGGDGFGGGLRDAPGDRNGSSFAMADGGLGFPIPNVDLSALDAGRGGPAGIFTGAPDVLGNGNYLPPAVTIRQNDVDGTIADLYIVNSLTIDASSTWNPPNNWRPVIVLVRTTVDIQGHIRVDAAGSTPGPGGYGSDCMNLGPGGGARIPSQNLEASGGGYCGSGGNGAAQLSLPALAGGMPYGSSTLTPLLGGSGGSCEGNPTGQGAGGGAIEIVAGQSITIEANGAISAGGGGGAGASRGSGAGGSGGAILLSSPSITIGGILAANGGAGGSSQGMIGGQSGQNGANATASAQPALGGQAGALPCGGNGSAGSTTSGGDGVLVQTDAGQTSAGFGGGGAGRIRINTASGTASLAATAVISPDLATSCATQGTLGQAM